MTILIRYLLVTLLSVAAALAAATTALASYAVSPVIVEREVSVGENLLPPISVTNSDKTKAAWMRVEVMGFGQTDLGSTFPIESDTSEHTASHLMQVGPREFELGPGEVRRIVPVVTVPDGTQGGKYATIVVGQVPEAGMTMVGQIAVAIILTVKDSSLEKSGRVVTIDAVEQTNGAVAFATSFVNDGNVHVRPTGRIAISRDGKKVANVPIEPHLVLPGYVRRLSAAWTPSGLENATYLVEVTLDIGGKPVSATGRLMISDAGVTMLEADSSTKEQRGDTDRDLPATAAIHSTDWRLIAEMSGALLLLLTIGYVIATRLKQRNR
jgi:hypothetical protein